MEKTIKVTVAGKEYFKVMGIIETYANNYIRIASKDEQNEIEFSCNIWKLRRLRHDFNLAMAMGIEMMIES